MRRFVCAAAAAGVIVAVACGGDGGGEPGGAAPPSESSPSGGAFGGNADASPDGSPGRACATHADCGAGGFCNPATRTCGCGGAAVAATVTPSNMLIVLDRSCSMTDKVGVSTKWDIAVAALNALIAANTGKIRFGLELFPDTTNPQCAQAAFSSAVGPGQEAAIAATLTAALAKADPNFPDGPCVTNIDTAVQAALSEPAFEDKTRKSFVLLITDGKQAGCSAGGGDPGTTTAIKDLRAKGVDTFVVGFGSGVDVAQMDAWAVEGGQPKGAASPRFFDAADKPSLDAALAAIAKKTLGCTLKLASPPPGGDVGLINVFLGKSTAPLPRDPTHAGNWDYDPATQSIVFYGPQCAALEGGTTEGVNVVFGCPGGPPPENPVK